MWVNKCQWYHGFVYFGEEYPLPLNLTGRMGESLQITRKLYTYHSLIIVVKYNSLIRPA